MDGITHALATPNLAAQLAAGDADADATVERVADMLEDAYLAGLADGLLGIQVTARAKVERRRAQRLRPLLATRPPRTENQP